MSTNEPTICAKCKWFMRETNLLPAICEKAQGEKGWYGYDCVTGARIKSMECEDINHGNCPHFEEPDHQR